MAEVYDVVIVGGGAAGLSAGIYAARARLKTVILERTALGGQIINTDVIENYPGFPQGITGPELIDAMQGQAGKYGLEYAFGEVMGLDVTQRPMIVRTEDNQLMTRTVIVSTGGDRNKLGVPGEEEFDGRGVSHCATCDGYFFADQTVTVVGGGDSAIDEGLYLTQMCSKVIVVHRRDKLRASNVLQERALENPKMAFIFDTVVDSITGIEVVESLILRNLKTEERRELATAGVFINIGFHPSTRPFQGVIPMDTGGHLKVDLNMATEVPGVFAAGDCRWRSTRQLVNCASDGVTAALSAYSYLEKS